jgi:hypothetical protein
MYGYHLGGDEDGWLIEGADEYGEFDLNQLDWYSEEDGFIESVERRLLEVVAGFTETDWRADGYPERKAAADATVGVEMESHCSGDYPMYVLAAKVITAYRGDAKVVELPDLVDRSRPGVESWNDKLTAALDALGITPKQQRPEWLLCSYWG